MLFELLQHILSEEGRGVLWGGLFFAVFFGIISYGWMIGAPRRRSARAGAAIGVTLGGLLGIMIALAEGSSAVWLTTFSAFSLGLRGFAGGVALDTARGNFTGLWVTFALVATQVFVLVILLAFPYLARGVTNASGISTMNVVGSLLSATFWGLGVYAALPGEGLRSDEASYEVPSAQG